MYWKHFFASGHDARQILVNSEVLLLDFKNNPLREAVRANFALAKKGGNFNMKFGGKANWAFKIIFLALE